MGHADEYAKCDFDSATLEAVREAEEAVERAVKEYVEFPLS